MKSECKCRNLETRCAHCGKLTVTMTIGDLQAWYAWISVNDRLPSLGQVCLLYMTYPKGTMFNCRADPLTRNFCRVGGLRSDGRFVSYDDQYSETGLAHISHWMALPSPPIQQNT